jgi:hypothetical protein
MNESTTSPGWIVIREDDNGNRYRIGHYATEAEAQKVVDGLGAEGHKQLYSVERIGHSASR